VRLPDDEERARKVSRLESQHIADTFFKSNLPWSQMSDHKRFGIPNFVHDISALLVQLIEQKYVNFYQLLPTSVDDRPCSLLSMRDAVECELLQCLADLGELPPLSTKEPSTEIMLRVSAFGKDVKDAVLGRKYYEFVQANRARYASFKTDIEMTAPDFRPFEHVHQTRPLIITLTQPRALTDVRNVIKG
jgi:hypothetical protein